MQVVERFAPSPTGPLHLGHAFSAVTAWRAAQDAGGKFLLRIEDIDLTRARANWDEAIYTDLTWLGLSWETPVLRQSTRLPAYRAALQSLWDNGLLYACHCNRKDIQAAVQAPQEGAPSFGPDGLIYPGTCAKDARNFGQLGKDMPEQCALRLSLDRAFTEINSDIVFKEIEALSPTPMTQEPARQKLGDIVLARREFGTSYHLSVVLDDAYQNVTHVTRGADLFEATYIQVILQQLLNLPTPTYRHHRLIRDDNGKRLAKRDDARAIAKYRADGLTPEDVLGLVGLDHRLA